MTGYPGMPANPGPRWPTSPPGCTRRSRSWRCCSRAWPPRGARARRRIQPVRRDDRRHGLRADLHPAFRHRPATPRGRLARGGALRRVSTRDGQTVVLGTTNDREWQRVAREIIDRPDLADDPRFATNPAAAPPRHPRRGHRILVCPTRSRRDPEDRGRRRDRQLPLQPAERGGGAPAVDGSRPLAHVGTSKGDIQALRPPPVITRLRTADGRSARARRAHRRGARRIGVGPDELARLRADGVIGPAYS